MTNEELNIYTYYNPYWHNFDILKQPISNPDTKRYIEELKKKGYDAVVDMVDASMGYSEAPVVVLDSKRNLKKTKTRTI